MLCKKKKIRDTCDSMLIVNVQFVMHKQNIQILDNRYEVNEGLPALYFFPAVSYTMFDGHTLRIIWRTMR